MNTQLQCSGIISNEFSYLYMHPSIHPQFAVLVAAVEQVALVAVNGVIVLLVVLLILILKYLN